MNVQMPAFLRPAEKREPATPPLPRIRPEEQRQMAMDFFNGHDRTLEENAYLRSENEHLRVELKVAQEQARMLESELAYVRDQHDRLQRHDATICAGVDHLMLIGTKLLAQARAEFYAPPGSGQEQQPEETEQDRQIVEGLAQKLAPEPPDA